jgi:polyphenol oxidase
LNPDWLIPDWPAPAGVRAVFTSRQGGFSSAPFDSLNLGDHVGDAPEKVAANRAALQTAIGSRPVFLKQVHGNKVLALDATEIDGEVADACVTSQRNIACTIMVADCLPVLLTSEDGSVVAAAHAGWRGLAGAGTGVGERAGKGVLESVYESFRALAQVPRAPTAIKIIAWMGPCIGPSAFEVGEEVKAAFEFVQPDASRLFVATGSGKYLADLAGLARLRLKALGVTDVYGNDGSPTWCTVSNPSRFFSHRRDAAVAGNSTGNGFSTTGRMAAAIWRI